MFAGAAGTADAASGAGSSGGRSSYASAKHSEGLPELLDPGTLGVGRGGSIMVMVTRASELENKDVGCE